MRPASALRSGKTPRGENFPVASRLLEAQHRQPILAFYDFVRTADDVADHPALAPEEKLAILDRLEASLTGKSDAEPEGVRLREILAERGLRATHAMDLLRAFRLDVTKRRYRDWEELMGYCRYSAMPVGRFVLEVHGEPRSTWAASDALCAALQVINHLQDCAADYRNLDRVYLPLDHLAAQGIDVDVLGLARAPGALRACIDELCVRVSGLLKESTRLSGEVRHARLALEVAVIQRLAERLVKALRRHDPLCERVHLTPLESAALALLGLVRGASQRLPRAALAVRGGESRPEGGAAATASGSSFYRAMRILPADRRSAIYEVYAFCRAIDDIADDGGERSARLERLGEWRGEIDAIYEGTPCERLVGLAEAVHRFALKREDFHAVIDGMEMDVREDIRAPELATLELYCDRVACAVGRLCVRIFGMDEQAGISLARHLGRALQLTNILRDLDEDAGIGRLYLPREMLINAGIIATDPGSVLAHPAITQVCRSLAEEALASFDAAEAIMAAAPPATVRAPRIMAEAYRSILRQLLERGFDAPRTPVRLARSQFARILIRRLVW